MYYFIGGKLKLICIDSVKVMSGIIFNYLDKFFYIIFFGIF